MGFSEVFLTLDTFLLQGWLGMAHNSNKKVLKHHDNLDYIAESFQLRGDQHGRISRRHSDSSDFAHMLRVGTERQQDHDPDEVDSIRTSNSSSATHNVVYTI